ncbi:alginate lyase family protein [Magnetococcales bacterium HHB-1]
MIRFRKIHYIRTLVQEQGFRTIIGKVWRLLKRKARLNMLFLHDYLFSSYCWRGVPEGDLHVTGVSVTAKELLSVRKTIHFLTEKVFKREFNLLGSSWIKVTPGLQARGTAGFCYQEQKDDQQILEVNAANRAESEKIRQQISKSYSPIHWHVDFKSGYRWPAKCWFHKISHGHRLGVDIKVPWELARMQHLVWLAWGYILAQEEDKQSDAAEKYRLEFQDQILDFIAANPPRFGVNNRSAMETGLRVVNWLVAYDLFVSAGASFDDSFMALFRRALYQHGRHILENLEWYYHRGNHYLSDIAGLLFIAAYLPPTNEINHWLAFAVQELLVETERQFFSEGSNFEDSTAYHRFSSEIVVYCAARVLSLSEEKKSVLQNRRLLWRWPYRPRLNPNPLRFYPVPGNRQQQSPLPPWFFERLAGMAHFAHDILRPDGSAPQIGDNDSGRFLKLFPKLVRPKGRSQEIHEDLNDYDHLLGAIAELIGDWDFLNQRSAKARLEALVIGRMAQKKGASLPEQHQTRWSGFANYPAFGLSMHQPGRFWFSVRCGILSVHGNGGHAHNDQLSMEMAVDGVTFIQDPGSFLYTALPQERNRFRSAQMHNTLSMQQWEPNFWLEGEEGLFFMMDRSQGHVVQAIKQRFVGEHRGFGFPYRREIFWENDRLFVKDHCEASGEKKLRFHLAPAVQIFKLTENRLQLKCQGVTLEVAHNQSVAWQIEPSYFSPVYGDCIPCQAIVLDFSERCETVFKIV